MPNRILREGILTSPRMAKLTWASEVFYRRLHSVVDDYGRYHAHPMLLRSGCYPLQIDKVTDSDIGKWIRETVEAGLVRVYPTAGGNSYLELLDFRQQVRAKVSKFPDPPADDTPLRSICAADDKHMRTKTDSYSESYSKSSKDPAADAAPAPSKPKGKAKTEPLPGNFEISDRVRKWAGEKGYGQLNEHLEAFKRKAEMKGYVYTVPNGWDLAFMEAIREDWAKLRGQQGRANGQPIPQAQGSKPCAHCGKPLIGGHTSMAIGNVCNPCYQGYLDGSWKPDERKQESHLRAA